jgi:hypothetical protein
MAGTHAQRPCRTLVAAVGAADDADAVFVDQSIAVFVDTGL